MLNTLDGNGYELCYNQKNLWQVSDNAPGAFYNQVLLRLKKERSLDQILDAIQLVMNKHETLSFRMKAGTSESFPVQFSSSTNTIDYSLTSLENGTIDELIEEQLNDPYDSSKNEPIRFCFVQNENGIEYLCLRFFALWSDTYSSLFFCDQLTKALDASSNYEKEKIEKIDYIDFCKWQNEMLSEPDGEAVNFWSSYNALTENEVIPFAKRSERFNPKRKQLLRIQGQEYARLKKFINENDLNTSDVLLSNFVDYLTLFTKDEITVGYVPFNRSFEDLDNTIASISKTIPVKFEGPSNGSIREKVSEIRRKIDEVENWADYFLLNKENGKSQNRFNYCFQFIDQEYVPINKTIVEIKNIYTVQNSFKVKVCCVDSGDDIIVDLYYDEGRFNADSLNTLEAQLKNFFNNETNTNDKLTALEFDVINSVNNTFRDSEYTESVLDLFEEQVNVNSDKIALFTNDDQITYKELNEKANQFKNYLIQKFDVKKGDPISILGSGSEWFVISMLGVLKSGAYYIPINREDPKERVEFIINESKTNILICDADLAATYHASVINVIVPSASEVYQEDFEDVVVEVNKKDTAYCIYTSGSTGNPKGCLISHANLSNYVEWANQFYFENSDFGNWGLITSISFDLTVTALYTSLTRGKRLWIGDARKDINELISEAFSNENVDTLKLTPSHLTLLKELDLRSTKVRKVICGGEQLTNDQIRTLKNLNNEIQVYNEYGPTEATVGCIVKEVFENDQPVQIGKPIANTRINIVNANGDFCNIGEIGELQISGVQVAIGYLNRPKLTEEKFVDNPQADARFYRTGDLGRWMPDGNIEYLGRKDNQVKIRGHRIELEEIEQPLLLDGSVIAAKVLVKNNSEGEKELVAFIISSTDLDKEGLRNLLLEKLPAYMVPVHFVRITDLPLTTNGKVDTSILLNMDISSSESGVEFVEPRNEVEEQVVKIWERVLNRKNISVTDDFTALGGHSIKAIRLINEYNKLFNIKFTLKEVFEDLNLEAHARIISNSTSQTSNVIIPTLEESEDYAISSAQRRLWISSQSKESSLSYSMFGTINMGKELDRDLFEKSIRAVINRHEVFRTVFITNADQDVRQRIIPVETFEFTIDFKDFRNVEKEQEALRDYIEADSNRPFDLENGPLFRLCIFQTTEEGFLFYNNMHHIISDGWSMDILERDVLAYYTAFQSGKEVDLPELKIQYKDYAAWQSEQFETEEYKKHGAFWADTLSGELPVLDLPSYKSRPSVKTHNGRMLSTYISRSATKTLQEYCQAKGGSLFMGLLSVWNILCNKYTAQNDIIVSTPIAGRDHADLEDQIGFYVNTLTLRNKIEASDSFNDIYNKTKENTLKAYEHQQYPFDRLVEDLEVKTDRSRNAIFDVMLVLHNTSENKIAATDFETDEIVDYGYYFSKIDIWLSFQEVGERLSMTLKYNTDVYDRTMIENLLVHFKQLLDRLMTSSELPVEKINYLSENEKDQLLNVFNDTAVDYEKGKTIVDLFEEQAEERPDHIAMVIGDQKTTFKELNNLSNIVARYIVEEHGLVDSESEIIAIDLSDREDLVLIALLGILKSGRAYLLVDSTLPQERVNFLLEDSGSANFFRTEDLLYLIDKRKGEANNNLNLNISESDLAYLIYTSGTTGRPKGVQIKHSSIVNYVNWFTEKHEVTAADSSIITSSLAFDLIYTSFYNCLLNGGELHFLRDISRKDPVRVSEYIVDQNITFLKVTPSYLNLLLNTSGVSNILKSDALRLILTGGERQHLDDVKRVVKESDIQMVNHYGPSESTIGVCTYEITRDNIDTYSLNPVIGNPISNVEIFILDENLELQPIGVSGEICISGAGLSTGYLNDSALTEKKFLKHPFNAEQRLYKTGDVGRRLPDGSVEFQGRVDDQVKIRGHRIELGEIEAAMLAQEFVSQATVAIKKVGEENAVVAYVVSESKLDKKMLRDKMSELLPEYMLPAYCVEMNLIPLTSNGKVNKRALPNVTEQDLIKEEYVAPRNEIEEQLVEIWQKVLKIDQIGITDNFFNIGGDSIKGVRIAAAIQRKFEIKINPTTLFKEATIKALSEEIDNKLWLSVNQTKEELVVEKIKI